MTLIEVVAGLALLTAVLGGILTAKTRFARQWARADQRVRAVEAADRLLTQWWQDYARVPRSGGGIVPGNAALAWQTRPVASADLEPVGGQIVRLTVGRAGEPDSVLATVDVIVPRWQIAQ